MKQGYYLIIIFVLIAMSLLVVGNLIMKEKNIKIGEIISKPELFNGKKVFIEATFNGWEVPSNCDANKTKRDLRSDTIISDETGCIFMSSNVEIYKKSKGEFIKINNQLDSNLDIGARIKVRGIISLIEGKPILGK